MNVLIRVVCMHCMQRSTLFLIDVKQYIIFILLLLMLLSSVLSLQLETEEVLGGAVHAAQYGNIVVVGERTNLVRHV